MAFLHGVMAINMKENGMQILNMERELSFLIMVIPIKGNTKMESLMGMGYILGLMGVIMKEILGKD